MSNDNIPPSAAVLREALTLSENILKNIELSEMPLSNIVLKVSRLARLLNDDVMQKIMEYESSGYPLVPGGLPIDLYNQAKQANREFEEEETKDKKTTVEKYVFAESVLQLEQEVEIALTALNAAADANVSISSANPYQHLTQPAGNKLERNNIRINIRKSQQRLASRKALVYSYCLKKHYELKYSNIAEDIFSRIRERVDSALGDNVPDAVKKISAVHESLTSENPENWSNAVHSCRRILQDLADALFPATEDKNLPDGKTIKLGADNYINRLMAFIEERASSDRFKEIVGSHLSYIGERLDSVFKAAQKGSHSAIVSQEEADRYVIYTYMLVGDILSLKKIK